MPHIKVTCYPKNLSEQQLQELNQELTTIAAKHLQASEEFVSIDYQEIEPERWQSIWDTEIQPRMTNLLKQPGYAMEKQGIVGVYAVGQVKAERLDDFKALIETFIVESRTHQGCISYNCGPVASQPLNYAFIARWATQEDLDLHMSGAFFQTHAPKMQEMLESGLDINIVNLD